MGGWGRCKGKQYEVGRKRVVGLKARVELERCIDRGGASGPD